MSIPNAKESAPLHGEVYSVSLLGLVATLITVMATIEPGPSTFDLIGLAEPCVQGTKSRVLSAFARVGQWFDDCRVKVQFSRNGLRHDGMLDLAVATAVLMALKQKALPRAVVLGELWPSGALRAARGALPALLGVRDVSGAIVPWNNGPETACLEHMEVRVAGHLGDVIDYLDGTRELKLARSFPKPRRTDFRDMADIRGLRAGRRAIEIAAAGLHPLLLVGSPGSGKTMLSSRLPTVLPEMSHPEALEVTSIHSVAGQLEEHEQGLLIERPFRIPHPKVGAEILVGRGFPPRPGEVSLAHHGVLFLDDIQTVHTGALSALDNALGAGQVELSKRVTFPARPLIVAGTFACPCGFHGVKDRECKCSPERIRAYRERQRGPVFDRLDMRALVSGDATEGPPRECSSAVRARVVKAREAQQRRFEREEASEPVNGRLGLSDLERVAEPDRKGRRMLGQAGLSDELEAKVLRVSRTIADLDGSDAVRARHVAEAIAMAPLTEN
ncbi:YifB family Mg chelatase-like AAA ATPase [Polyangium aurulentum]|uniref:YifB family Mg chelatase-like AAA ATPase n=1 Tax=Polyangium aurulentum TaxID=2567896 RepID=UPI0010ADEB57|nr:ATP-binding protein [Polyangium aurulentum]UQA61836.1 ATP-binding protein [Polyangium aurulentum]